MDIIKQFRSYLLEDEFKINIFKDKVNIANYIKIKDISNNKISIVYDNGEVNVIGSKLVISKLLNNEILITGIIKNIELS